MSGSQQDPEVNWKLVHAGDGSKWKWRRLRTDGSVELASPPLPDFGAAVGDAINHGFRPGQQNWVVKSRNHVTHYEPGAFPVSTSTGSRSEI